MHTPVIASTTFSTPADTPDELLAPTKTHLPMPTPFLTTPPTTATPMPPADSLQNQIT